MKIFLKFLFIYLAICLLSLLFNVISFIECRKLHKEHINFYNNKKNNIKYKAYEINALIGDSLLPHTNLFDIGFKESVLSAYRYLENKYLIRMKKFYFPKYLISDLKELIASYDLEIDNVYKLVKLIIIFAVIIYAITSNNLDKLLLRILEG